MRTQQPDGTWFDDEKWTWTTPANRPPVYCTLDGMVMLDGRWIASSGSKYDAFTGIEIPGAGYAIRYCPEQDPAILRPEHDVWTLIPGSDGGVWIKR